MIRKFSALAVASALALSIPGSSNAGVDTKPTKEVKDNIWLYDSSKNDEQVWKCIGCNTAEDFTLSYLQDNTSIKDKIALATIMGNIKQESMFNANICEGGARVPYHKCYSGGYGLIQWTTAARYKGLGSFCNKYGCDPSSLEGQVRYMINENGFQKNLSIFEAPGRTINYYMNAAYSWLGWGIHGHRTHYTHQYVSKLVLK